MGSDVLKLFHAWHAHYCTATSGTRSIIGIPVSRAELINRFFLENNAKWDTKANRAILEKHDGLRSDPQLVRREAWLPIQTRLDAANQKLDGLCSLGLVVDNQTVTFLLQSGVLVTCNSQNVPQGGRVPIGTEPLEIKAQNVATKQRVEVTV